MNGLVMAAQLILGLSILVILHEFGHYIAARAFGIRVEKFYLFFDAWGVKLFSFKKGDTEY
jgi:regulator of sigma E protease